MRNSPWSFPFVVHVFVLDDILVLYVRGRRRIELREMPGLQMYVEGRAALVDFIEQDMVRHALLHQYIEAVAAGLLGQGLARVLLDQGKERIECSGEEIKIDGDEKALHEDFRGSRFVIRGSLPVKSNRAAHQQSQVTVSRHHTDKPTQTQP